MVEEEPRVRTEPDFEDAWPGASRLATECILNLGFLHQQTEAFGQSLVRRHGVPSVAAFNVLTILHGASESLPPSTIAERMIVSRPTMTGVLGTLERRGLVRRLPHGKDHRMALIEITSEGRSRVERLRPELHQAEKRWMACLTEGEQRALLSMLAKLEANALG